MTRRRWRLRASLAGLLSLGMLASVSTPGAAAPPTDPATPPSTKAAAPSGGTSGQPIASTTVTLITGDVVTVGINADKKLSATVSTVARRGDGSRPTFLQVQDGDAHYVYPSDAVGLIEAGKLDQRLFDVNYLAVNGYADAQTTSLPLIVQYHQPSRAAQDAGRGARDLAASVDALPGTASPRALYSINAAATKVDRKQVNRLWTALIGGARPAAARAIDQGVSKIWLDAKAKVNLDVSVPQIGAPAAWDAGYTGTGVKVAILDTGADLNHPDLTGKVTTSQSFVPEEEVQDGHGHGTHVAATVAGSGAAADGKYKGVAPGADLMVGKVLSNGGSGLLSWAVEGMEWAAANGADIVSMSLSATDTPDIDPMEQAVGDLTAQYGTLFVIAAGNSGGTDRTIGSPGSAPDALTVAAVDKQDKLASFSSRGPTAGAYVSKPDISAPGVDIVAARAAGTTMGTPVDDLHTKASGTSMATPHVAGAAAILAQQHPDWTGQQLKAVLTASAVDTPATPLEEGAGRVDIARAVSGKVHGNGRLDFGHVAYPHNKPVSQTLTYTNTGDTAVTLNLAASFDSRVGAAPEDTLTLDKSTVEVPANGTATVTVTLDFTKDQIDTWYSGIITATGGDVSLRTAVGAFKSPKRGKVTVKTISGPNMPGMAFGGFGALRADDRSDLDTAYVFNGGPEVTLDVMVGKFSLMGSVSWYDADGTWNLLPVSAPEFTVDGDTTVTLDLRKATPLKVRTPKASDEYRLQGGLSRTAASGLAMNLDSWDLPYGGRLWSLPTNEVTTGSFHAYSQHVLGAPPITMSSDGLSLHPRYLLIDPLTPMLDGEHRLAAVSGGTGTVAELSKVDANGKLVLLDLSDLCPTPVCDFSARDRVANAHAAGAAAVVFHGTTGRAAMVWQSFPYDQHAYIPLLNLPAEEGRALAAAISDRPVTVNAKSVANSPYIYSLKFYQREQVPTSPNLSVDKRNLVEFDSRFHSDKPGYHISRWTATKGLSDYSGALPLSLWVASRSTRTEYVGPVADDVAWSRTNVPVAVESLNPFVGEQGIGHNISRRYTEPGRHTEHWGQQPFAPGVVGIPPEQVVPGTQSCSDCRLGDVLYPRHINRNIDGMTGDASWNADNYGTPLTEELRLFQGDREIPIKLYGVYLFFFIAWFPTFAVSEEPGTYRMTSKYHGRSDVQLYGRDIDTEWMFRSQRPDPQDESGRCGLVTLLVPGPCYAQRKLFLDYDVDLALDNTAKAGRPQVMTVSGYGESYTDPSAKLTSLTAEVSYDSGATWKRVPALKIRGSYKVFLWHPPLNGTDGTVSLRTSATDNYGNTIKQTIKKAYGLR